MKPQPTKGQINVINKVLDGLLESDFKGASKGYILGKLTSTVPKTLETKIENGRLLAQVTLFAGLKTPWVEIPAKERYRFP